MVEPYAEGVPDQPRNPPTAPQIVGVSMGGGPFDEHPGQTLSLFGIEPRRTALVLDPRQRGFPAAPPALQPLRNGLPGDANTPRNFRGAIPVLKEIEPFEPTCLVRFEISLGFHANSIALEASLSS